MKENVEKQLLCEQAKQEIIKLVTQLQERKQPSPELLDIIDVLHQVHAMLDKAKDPGVLINHMVNYIRSMAIKGRLHFPAEEEKAMMALGVIGQRAGWNSQYIANFSDKSQFYRFGESVPRH